MPVLGVCGRAQGSNRRIVSCCMCTLISLQLLNSGRSLMMEDLVYGLYTAGAFDELNAVAGELTVHGCKPHTVG